MGKVDICAGERVGDAGGRDILGWVSVSVEPVWTREVSVIGLGIGISHTVRGVDGGLGVMHTERES